MEGIISECKQTGTYNNGKIKLGEAFLGVHTCICGEKSTSYDYLISNNYSTNSLCAHYLKWHRHEIPEGELEKVMDISTVKIIGDRLIKLLKIFIKEIEKAIELKEGFPTDVCVFILELISISVGIKKFWENKQFSQAINGQLKSIKKYITSEEYNRLNYDLVNQKVPFNKMLEVYEEKVKNAPEHIRDILKL